MTELTLRKATKLDSETLLALRNDPLAVQMSRSQLAITREEHTLWLEDVLAGRLQVLVYVIDLGVFPIGYARIALSGDGAYDTAGWVSIVVREAERGKHYGWQALDLLIGQARTQLFMSKLKATIKRDNLASRRLFTRFGFIQTVPNGEWLEYERAL